jgi:Putative inner membrane protein (DUF1819)
VTRLAAHRADVASSFTLIKGSMIEETYAVLAAWDFAQTKKQNLDRLRHENFIGAGSITWLRDIAKVLNRRVDPTGRDRPLIVLAKGGCSVEVWKPIFLWHITRDEFLLRDFLINWLWPAYEAGAYRVRPEALHEYLATIAKRGGKVEHAWSPATTARVAVGLLRMATDFGLLKGTVVREFASYHLPEPSFLYLLQAILEETGSPGKAVDSPDWRMFLMSRAEVERELLRLHQFRKLSYEVAGSLIQLALPCASAGEFAEGMVA